MGGGPPGFRQGFSCPALLDTTHIRSASFSLTRLSRPLASHSNYSANHADFLPYPSHDSARSHVRYLEPKFKFSDMVLCDVTTPYKHWPISRTQNKTKPTVFSHRAVRRSKSAVTGCSFSLEIENRKLSLILRTCKVWAHPVSLATTPRIVIYFLFLILLRCFSSDGSRSLHLCIQCRTT